MNSRQRRKDAASEYNKKRQLICEIGDLRSAIFAKYGTDVMVCKSGSIESLNLEISRLRDALDNGHKKQKVAGTRITQLIMMSVAYLGAQSSRVVK